LAVFVAIAIGKQLTSHHGVRYDGDRVYSVLISDGGEMQRLNRIVYRHNRLGQREVIDVMPDYVLRVGENHLRVSAQVGHTFVNALDRAGLKYRLIVDDIQKLIDLERYMQDEAAADDFFSAYRSYDEFVQFINDIASQYPSLATKVNLGKTVEGRDILGWRITSSKMSSKKGIFYNGCQHAREWISPMTVAYIANEFVTKYGNDSSITSIVDNFEWTIIPIVNADGYVYTQTDRMWRKNRRKNNTCYGVDTNRNWGFHWNEGGSSNNPCSDTYAGPSAFSEPEITALRDYLNGKTNVAGFIDFHSYGQLYMNPWGYSTSDCADNAVQESLAKQSVADVYKVHQQTYEYGPIAQILYIASGSSTDWAYGSRNITYSYGIELRDTGQYGFLLPPNQIVPQGEEIMPLVKDMANWILKN